MVSQESLVLVVPFFVPVVYPFTSHVYSLRKQSLLNSATTVFHITNCCALPRLSSLCLSGYSVPPSCPPKHRSYWSNDLLRDFPTHKFNPAHLYRRTRPYAILGPRPFLQSTGRLELVVNHLSPYRQKQQ